MSKHELDIRELSAVLAGLRLLQASELSEGPWNRPAQYQLVMISDILDNGGTIEPLGLSEIDALCERLNTSEDA